MLYVKAIAGDIWPTAPLQPIGERVLEKQLVRALEHGSWGGQRGARGRVPWPGGFLSGSSLRELVA